MILSGCTKARTGIIEGCGGIRSSDRKESPNNEQVQKRNRAMASPATPLEPTDHAGYMRLALSLAVDAPLKDSNYRVGALLLDPRTNTVLSTGYTLELDGNTHAEECCLLKCAAEGGVSEDEVGVALPVEGAVLYTTLEPCVRRLSGKETCVERILKTRRKEGRKGVVTVYVGAREPDRFVEGNDGMERLRADGVRVEVVDGLQEEILRVATAGHEQRGDYEVANPS